MYYTIISKTPLINNNLSRDEKMFRTFLIGSICYVITHALLYSPKFSNQIIEKYRNYIYYIWGVDLSVAFVMTKFLGSDHIPIDMNINSYAESETESHHHINHTEDNQKFQLETNGDKLTRDEIMERFYKQQMQNKQDPSKPMDKSPFIKSKKENKEEVENKEILENKQEVKQEKNSKQNSENKNENKIANLKNNNKEINVSSEEKISESYISDTEIKTYKGKNNININNLNMTLSA